MARVFSCSRVERRTRGFFRETLKPVWLKMLSLCERFFGSFSGCVFICTSMQPFRNSQYLCISARCSPTTPATGRDNDAGFLLCEVDKRVGLMRHCRLYLPCEAKRENARSVVLATDHCNFTMMPIEQRLHLAFRFILDALVGLKRRVAALATRKRDRSQLDDLEFSFPHSRWKNAFHCLRAQHGDYPRQEQVNADIG